MGGVFGRAIWERIGGGFILHFEDEVIVLGLKLKTVEHTNGI